MSATLPEEQRNVIRGKVVIKKIRSSEQMQFIHPNVKISEDAIIGRNSIVLKDVEPWSINVGSPCKKIGERPKV